MTIAEEALGTGMDVDWSINKVLESLIGPLDTDDIAVIERLGMAVVAGDLKDVR